MHFYRIVLSTHNHNDINYNGTYTNTGKYRRKQITDGNRRTQLFRYERLLTSGLLRHEERDTILKSLS